MSEKEFDREFININKDFWSRYKEPLSQDILLVETSDNPAINHSNAVAGKIVATAKNLRIGWINYEFTDEALMRSYSPNSLFIRLSKVNVSKKIWFLFCAIFYYISQVLIVNRILSFNYRGVPYGDFIYDGYLATFSMATLHRFDVRMIYVFFTLLLRDEQARLTLDANNIKAILVAHYIGMGTGPLSRVALQRNIPVYWKGGGHEVICFSVFKNLEQRYDYPLKPTKEEINLLLKDYSRTVESDFIKFIDQADNPSYGALSVAFNNVITSDIQRGDFLKIMNLEDRPLIFVMLHAFNDFPCSHFRKLLFNDYYEWFIKTLRFAVSDKSKNWVFKEHPANEFYPTRDLDLPKLMAKMPGHIKYISAKSKITAATVLNVADFIISCIGTAGVEMPALRGIPSLIAGDTFYDGLGFTVEPKSREEYFNVLRNLSPRPLTAHQRMIAKCCYLYLKRYVLVDFAAGPAITYDESKSVQKLKQIYPERIANSYKNYRDKIYCQFEDYAADIKRDNFRRLVRFPAEKDRVNINLNEKEMIS